jgi:cytochrome c551/c552
MKLLSTLIVACGLMTVNVANAALDDDAAQAIMKKGGCTACHKLDKAGAGPSIKDIAKKQKGKAGAPDELKKAVREGSKGLYGADSAMPGYAASKISDADLVSLIQWILTK